ncbi:MAG: sugar phosphate isomerase/epimerase [Methanomicrobiales archaeon]|nr:sugar phosphate isomerase/epimerase [Methanomicrobiales archaeon]
MFAVSTFCLHAVPLESALNELTAITDHIEVMDEGLHHLGNADILKNYSARYTIHAPSRGTNLASLLEPIRRASVDVMADCFRIAGEVNGSVVLHPGYFAWEEERTKAEQQLVRSLADLHRLAAEFSVEFFVENMGNWQYFLLKTPAELPLIGATAFALDVGHAHQNHCLAGFLACPARHYHLHDNDGSDDTHAAIGEGTIDFGPVMQAVRRDGVVPVIEVADLPGVKKSIERLGLC